MAAKRLSACLAFPIAFSVAGLVANGDAIGQMAGERSLNSNVWSSPGARIPLPTDVPLINEPVAEVETTEDGERLLPGAAEVTPLPGELFVTQVTAMARAAVIEDSTRLNGASGPAFLPSGIPVAGDPFFGSDSRSTVQGSGSSLDLLGRVIAPTDEAIHVDTRLVVDDFGFGDGDSADEDSNVDIQQAYAHYNGLLVGLTDTAVSNFDALPEIIDLAGPNARVTVFDDGIGEGQGRLSYFITRPEGAGLTTNLSIEQPRPEINRLSGPAPGDTIDTFARFPDLLFATRYGDGGYLGDEYIEKWHVQFGSLGRSLGLENDNGTFVEEEFGWGLFLSSAYRFNVNPRTCQRDGIFGSIAYGEGIGHYIVDLHGQGDINNNDAALDGAGNLETLPALAWYAAYQHNWTRRLRSTVTYSHVFLDSIPTPTQAESPYHQGQYVQMNLIYHREFHLTDDATSTPHYFYTGIEWLYGKREALDGSEGDANRLMWLVAFAK